MPDTNLDRLFRTSIASGRISSSEARVIRALIETVPGNATFDKAVAVGTHLHACGMTGYQIRSQYPMGGITHDFVLAAIQEVVAA